MFSAQSSLSIFTQKYLYKCEDTYFILENKYLCIYVDSFGAKIFREVKKTFKLYAQAQISLFHSEMMNTIRPLYLLRCLTRKDMCQANGCLILVNIGKGDI